MKSTSKHLFKCDGWLFHLFFLSVDYHLFDSSSFQLKSFSLKNKTCWPMTNRVRTLALELLRFFSISKNMIPRYNNANGGWFHNRKELYFLVMGLFMIHPFLSILSIVASYHLSHEEPIKTKVKCCSSYGFLI